MWLDKYMILLWILICELVVYLFKLIKLFFELIILFLVYVLLEGNVKKLWDFLFFFYICGVNWKIKFFWKKICKGILVENMFICW